MLVFLSGTCDRTLLLIWPRLNSRRAVRDNKDLQCIRFEIKPNSLGQTRGFHDVLH